MKILILSLLLLAISSSALEQKIDNIGKGNVVQSGVVQSGFYPNHSNLVQTGIYPNQVVQGGNVFRTTHPNLVTSNVVQTNFPGQIIANKNTPVIQNGNVLQNNLVRSHNQYGPIVTGGITSTDNSYYIDSTNEQRTINVSRATAASGFSIYLRGNFSTGANWFLVSYNSNILQALNLKANGTGTFIPDNNLLGSNGWAVFRFRPINLGSTILKFRYRRFGKSLRWINIFIRII
jgi:predicted secreted protein